MTVPTLVQWWRIAIIAGPLLDGIIVESSAVAIPVQQISELINWSERSVEVLWNGQSDTREQKPYGKFHLELVRFKSFKFIFR